MVWDDSAEPLTLAAAGAVRYVRRESRDKQHGSVHEGEQSAWRTDECAKERGWACLRDL